VAKYVFVVGGTYSTVGKGISIASMALLLKMRGLRVDILKLDGYYNTNAGCLSPTEHGETFVLDDGTETDLDLGTYERIAGITISQKNIVTNGILYRELLDGHDQGKYLGKTVQLVPHYTEIIIDRLNNLGKDQDIVFVEIGGTIGDMESAGFLEATRQFKQQHTDALICMVAPILWVPTIKEFKTKPLQNAVKTLQSFGLQPDILLCRTPANPPLAEKILDKVALMTNVHRNAVFEAPDVPSIYCVPISFWNCHLDDLIADKLHLQRNGVRIHKYRNIVENYTNGHDFPVINIGVVGKYENCDEAYHSLKEALTHAAVANNVKLDICWISAEDLESVKRIGKQMDGLNGVIVPGGFDIRGVEGKIRAIEHSRMKKIPFLGICFGLQCSVIEYCRNVLEINEATSEEFDKDAKHKVIHYIPGQKSILKKSGTMRLGAYDCVLTEGSLAHKLYGKKKISERHRHRYEINGEYVDRMQSKGYNVSGYHYYGDNSLVEIMELDQNQHSFFVATQSHAEFKSRLTEPSPLFNGLIKAAVEHHKS
jgi:CTP synthase